MRLTGIAFGHLRRGKGRAALVIAGLTLGVATVVGLANIAKTLERHMGDELDRYGANIVVTPQTDGLEVSYGGISVSGISYQAGQLTTEDVERLHSIELADRLATVAPVIIGAADVNDRRAAVAGIRLEEHVRLKQWWRVFGRVPASTDEVLVGYEAAQVLGVIDEAGGPLMARPVDAKAGAESAAMEHADGMDGQMRMLSIIQDRLKIAGREFTVAGVLEATGAADDRLIFAELDQVQSLLDRPRQLSLIEVAALCADCPVDDIVAQIADALPTARVTPVSQAVAARSMAVSRLTRFGAALAAVVLIVGGLLVLVTMTSSVAERRREIGMLRAIGFRREHILKILGIEVTVLGLLGGIIGWGAGMAAAILAVRYFTEGASLRGGIDPAMIPLALGGAVLVSALGAIYPAWKASKLDPTEALRDV